MIWLETPIVNDVRFRQYIRLYKRFIDDLFLIWTGPAAVLCDFRRALATADEAISLDWSGYKSHQEAVDPSAVMATRFARAARRAPAHTQLEGNSIYCQHSAIAASRAPPSPEPSVNTAACLRAPPSRLPPAL